MANGFYGEYLARAPGVSDTVTLFCNSSGETSCTDSPPEASFGHSAVLIHKNHKLKEIDRAEYSTDDFEGRPVCRLRFGAATRLYYFSLPFFHELDPRATRTPIKVHAIFRPEQEQWIRLSSQELTCESKMPEASPAKTSRKVFPIEEATFSDKRTLSRSHRGAPRKP